MELKVWVEGIQRIVCGVNEKTTCQDVVFALAHATGKTGRFTLIERWRNSERLLAPNEQPLKVLLKWGEHSNDVQFILQWSPLDSTSSAIKSGQTQSGKFHSTGGVDSSCSDNSSSHSPLLGSKSTVLPAGAQSNLSSGNTNSDALSPLSQINGPAGVKKSTTTGSLSSYTSNVSSESRPVYSSYSQNGQEIANTPSHVVENLTNGDALKLSKNGGVQRSSARQFGSDNISLNYPVNSSGSNGKLLDAGISSIQSIGKLDTKLSTPPPYREPPSPSCHSTPPLTSPNPGMSSPGVKSLPPYREPPPPNVSHLPTYLNKGGNTASAAVHGISPSAMMKGNQSSSFAPHNIPSSMNNSGLNEAIGSGFVIPSQKETHKYLPVAANVNPQNDSLSSISSTSEKSEAWKTKDHHTSGGEISFNLNGSSKSSVNPNPPKSNSQYKDLIRVVNSQREKLTSQQAELTQFDAEIMFWEGKAREQQRHMELINKEISRLEAVSAQHESQVLSLAHLEEENEFTQRESAVLKSEINCLRSELDKCDDEIEKCKQRIRSLVDELHSTQNQMAQRQEEWMQRESATIVEIERLRRELDLIRRDTDTMNDMSGSLENEVLSIESSLSEKKRQMEKLIAAMKEANLQSLSIQPPDELIEAHHRSGSTRRMIGSPRQLENAAPTSKNPHGVWV